MLEMSARDQEIVDEVDQVIEGALVQAENPVAVVKRLASRITRRRNRGRKPAMKRHPFTGICEASGMPLAREHAHLDEVKSEAGYAGPVRWVCPRANNSGTFSCGHCQ